MIDTQQVLNLYAYIHGLRTPGEEISFTAWPKIKSQIFRYSQSIFCLPHWPIISNLLDLPSLGVRSPFIHIFPCSFIGTCIHFQIIELKNAISRIFVQFCHWIAFVGTVKWVTKVMIHQVLDCNEKRVLLKQMTDTVKHKFLQSAELYLLFLDF